MSDPDDNRPAAPGNGAPTTRPTGRTGGTRRVRGLRGVATAVAVAAVVVGLVAWSLGWPPFRSSGVASVVPAGLVSGGPAPTDPTRETTGPTTPTHDATTGGTASPAPSAGTRVPRGAAAGGATSPRTGGRVSSVPRPGRTVTVAAVGDIACDPGSSSFAGGVGSGMRCRQRAVADLVASRRPAAFLPLGDIQYEDGTLAAFRASYDKAFGRFRSITYPVVGNHEYHTAGAAGYFDYFGARAGARGKGWYSVDLGAWHVVALNANCGEVSCRAGSEQESWLRADLARNRSRCTLALWHQPRWSSGSEHGDSTSVAPLVEALHAGGVDVLLSAHDHDYERFAPQNPDGVLDRARGVRQFVVGGGGKNLYTVSGKQNTEAKDDTTFGALFLTLSPSSYSWRYAAAVGSYSDSGSTACH